MFSLPTQVHPAQLRVVQQAAQPHPQPQLHHHHQGGLWGPHTPATPFRVDPDSLRVWQQHTAAAVAWLRAHDHGTRCLASLEDPGACVGVLVEPREHADTEFVLRNWAHFAAPQGWGLVVVHGTKNEAFMRQIAGAWPNVRFLSCGADDLPLPAYQRLLTDTAFWSQFLPYRRVVLLQTDVALLRGDTLGPRAPFLEYDYVGAPWANACVVCGSLFLPLSQGGGGGGTGGSDTAGGGDDPQCCAHMIDQRALQTHLAPHLVGNGGLSLRNPRAMVAACSKYCLPSVAASGEAGGREALHGVTNEDVFMCVALAKLGYRIAPRDVALQFAVEQVLPLVMDPTTPSATGVHKMWLYHRADRVRAVFAAVQYVDPGTGDACRPTKL